MNKDEIKKKIDLLKKEIKDLEFDLIKDDWVNWSFLMGDGKWVCDEWCFFFNRENIVPFNNNYPSDIPGELFDREHNYYISDTNYLQYKVIWREKIKKSEEDGQ